MTHLVFQTEPASPSPKLAWPVCAMHKHDCICGHVYICASGCTCVGDNLQAACICVHACSFPHVCVYSLYMEGALAPSLPKQVCT